MVQLADQWAGTRWAREPHIRFGDPCFDCAVPMTPASRWWSALTIPNGMRKHGGSGLCTGCANRRRRQALGLDQDTDRRMAALARSIVRGGPCSEHGRIHPGVLFPLAGIGAFWWGWTHSSSSPNGATLTAVLIIALTLAIIGVFGWRYRRRERLAAAATAEVESRLQQDTTGDHIWDA